MELLQIALNEQKQDVSDQWVDCELTLNQGEAYIVDELLFSI